MHIHIHEPLEAQQQLMYTPTFLAVITVSKGADGSGGIKRDGQHQIIFSVAAADWF
jgi:hypothetical protein